MNLDEPPIVTIQSHEIKQHHIVSNKNNQNVLVTSNGANNDDDAYNRMRRRRSRKGSFVVASEREKRAKAAALGVASSAPTRILTSSRRSASFQLGDYDEDDVKIENDDEQKTFIPSGSSTETSSKGRGSIFSGIDTYSENDDEFDETFRGRSLLKSPRIRLKVLDVANMNPTGMDATASDPTDDRTLREMQQRVHSSVVKQYNLVIAKKVELPVVNTALAQHRLLATQAADAAKERDRKQNREIRLPRIDTASTDKHLFNATNSSSLDWTLSKKSNTTSNSSSLKNSTLALKGDDTTSSLLQLVPASKQKTDLKSITIGLFDNYTVNNNPAAAAITVRSDSGLTYSYSTTSATTGTSAIPIKKTSLRRTNTQNFGQIPTHSESKSQIKNYFRHKVRLVMALIKILECAANKAEVTKEFLKMATDYISEIVQDSYNPNDDDHIVFNKDFYKAKKETEVGKEMQYALTIPPEARTPEQIKMVRLGLRRLSAFVEYPIYMQEKICRCAFYQKVPAKRVIIRQGQIADSFYFIITGQAMVTILEEEKNTNETKNRIVAILKEGTCFGELAFLYNTTRTATVTSLTNMELISIGRQDFYDIFMSKRGEEPEHIRYIRMCPFTEFWPVHMLLKNPQHCLFHYYKKGQVIVKDSHECDYIYVVKSGSCQVLKRLNQVKPRRILPIRSNAFSRGFALNDNYQAKVDTGLKHKSQSSDPTIPWTFTTIDDFNNSFKSESRPVFLQIQLLKEGDTFGLNTLKFDESDRNIPDPVLSLVSNGCEVVMLRKDVFLKNADTRVRNHIRQLVQPYPESEVMQEKLQNKADWIYFKTKIIRELMEDMHVNHTNMQTVHKNKKDIKAH